MGLCDWVADPQPDDPDHRKPVRVFHPHELRHTAASLAIAAGADIKAIQAMLGHKDATLTLNLYEHRFDDRLGTISRAVSEARAKALRGDESGQSTTDRREAG